MNTWNIILYYLHIYYVQINVKWKVNIFKNVENDRII